MLLLRELLRGMLSVIRVELYAYAKRVVEIVASTRQERRERKKTPNRLLFVLAFRTWR